MPAAIHELAFESEEALVLGRCVLDYRPIGSETAAERAGPIR